MGWRSTRRPRPGGLWLAGDSVRLRRRHAPGLAPDGDPISPAHHAGPGQARSADRRLDYTLSEARRELSFWWISFGHASALFVVSAMGVHLVSHLKESQGYSLGQASAVVCLMTLLFLTGTVSGGLLGDRVNKRMLVVCCMAMHMAGLLLLSHATNLGVIVGFTILHWLAWGWRGPQMAALRADCFGRSAFGKILGLSNMIVILGTISGPLIAGLLYDQTGNYRVGFDFLAAIAATGSAFFILARKPAGPKRAMSAA